MFYKILVFLCVCVCKSNTFPVFTGKEPPQPNIVTMESVNNASEELPVTVSAVCEVKQDKVSTGVGGTPPREVPSELTSSEPTRKISTSTGTSPPPQNISTQVQKTAIRRI